MPTTHLLYLHGFRSSPRSTKAQQVAARVRARHPEVHWWCPQLPASPHEAAELIAQGIADWPHEQMAVIGSSLGGYYATWVAERQGCRAVVLNPAVDPARDLAVQVGQQTAWHEPSEQFLFRHEYVSELRALHAGPLADPTHYLAVIAKGDEVLDWREMAQRYAGARIRLLEGSNHALSDFSEHLDEVLAFVGL
ncbi:MAG TPA: YqiA/YcfP family alpha/beta fold hydrolase [Ottowia sp.]|uniref:YqiA/YcfP family alpha/beta fold hydrolase n=1 Tax=Ottowia sp. TaxID=1898956 RepID=UPI002C214FF1|nr:YqiA/YcfP family alpha/beta fold hydrolase [Ottowia sp.]HMN22349.1 YqiA/YcfP family alpha/beta fold hydrolase [Ottowia sp.]